MRQAADLQHKVAARCAPSSGRRSSASKAERPTVPSRSASSSTAVKLGNEGKKSPCWSAGISAARGSSSGGSLSSSGFQSKARTERPSSESSATDACPSADCGRPRSSCRFSYRARPPEKSSRASSSARKSLAGGQALRSEPAGASGPRAAVSSSRRWRNQAPPGTRRRRSRWSSSSSARRKTFSCAVARAAGTRKSRRRNPPPLASGGRASRRGRGPGSCARTACRAGARPPRPPHSAAARPPPRPRPRARPRGGSRLQRSSPPRAEGRRTSGGPGPRRGRARRPERRSTRPAATARRRGRARAGKRSCAISRGEDSARVPAYPADCARIRTAR